MLEKLVDTWRCNKSQIIRQLITIAGTRVSLHRPLCADGSLCLMGRADAMQPDNHPI